MGETCGVGQRPGPLFFPRFFPFHPQTLVSLFVKEGFSLLEDPESITAPPPHHMPEPHLVSSTPELEEVVVLKQQLSSFV